MDEVQADQPRSVGVSEVAAHGFAHHGMQLRAGALLAFFVTLYETNEAPVPPWLYRALEEAGGRPTS
jgi:hypothetical protein